MKPFGTIKCPCSKFMKFYEYEPPRTSVFGVARYICKCGAKACLCITKVEPELEIKDAFVFKDREWYYTLKYDNQKRMWIKDKLFAGKEYESKKQKRIRTYVKMKCPVCGKTFERDINETFLSKKMKNKIKLNACSLSCAGKLSHMLKKMSESEIMKIKSNMILKIYQKVLADDGKTQK